MSEKQCPACQEMVEADRMVGDRCRRCADKKRFADFAESCGLGCYPDPTGDRYIYCLDGDIEGKKSECIDFMDELWDALVRAKSGNTDLLLFEE